MIEKLKSIFSSIKADLADTWKRSKMVLLSIGAILVAIEFNKIKDFFTSYMAKKEMKNTENKDTTLKAQEEELNTTANKLVEDANKLANQDKPVGLDWNKK